MTLRGVVDSLEGMPEHVATQYVQLEDGRYQLQVEDIEAHPDVRGLALHVEQLRKERDMAKAQLADLQPIIDAEVAVEQAEQLEREIAEEKARAEREVAAAKSEAEAARAAAVNYFIESEIARAAKAAGAAAELIQPALRPRINATIKNGKLDYTILDRDGFPRFRNAAGDPMRLDDAVTELQFDPVYSKAFDAPTSIPPGMKTVLA